MSLLRLILILIQFCVATILYLGTVLPISSFDFFDAVGIAHADDDDDRDDDRMMIAARSSALPVGSLLHNRQELPSRRCRSRKNVLRHPPAPLLLSVSLNLGKFWLSTLIPSC